MLRRAAKIPSILLMLAAFGILTAPMQTLASTYGSGAYNTCGYDTSCPTASSAKKSTASSGSTTPAATSGEIILNDYSEYFTDNGKTLDLSPGQIIYFDVTVDGTSQRHSITIKAVHDASVDIEINSTPIDATLAVNQISQYDVTGDGTNDIKIALNSITDGKANMTFYALSAAVKTPNATTPSTSAPAATPRNWWLWIIIFGGCLIAGLWLFIFLWKRRRRRDDQTTPTTLPPQ